MMNETANLDLIWWITVVEIPALVGLFLMIWRNRRDFETDLGDLKDQTDRQMGHNRECLAAYKLEVAKNYASITYMKDVERRLTGHLVRIENKLDHGGMSHAGS